MVIAQFPTKKETKLYFLRKFKFFLKTYSNLKQVLIFFFDIFQISTIFFAFAQIKIQQI